MALNFIQHINQNWDASSKEKQQFLDDFCEKLGYKEEVPDSKNKGEMISNPVSKTAFANQKIKDYIMKIVNALRRARAESEISYDKLENQF